MIDRRNGMRGLVAGVVSLVAACGTVFGQLELVTNEPVERAVLDMPIVVDTVRFAPLDIQGLLVAERLRPQGEVPQFAKPHQTDITPVAHGTVQLLPNGRLAWRLKLEGENAQSINFGSLYDVPDSVEMYLLNSEGFTPYGAFTADSGFQGQMWSPILTGTMMEIYAEMDEADWDEFVVGFRIMYVNLGFRGLGEALAGREDDGLSTRSDPCHTDVACRDADPWCQHVKGAVCYTIFGTGTCSGSLLNNTASDERPIFYTAFHCGAHSNPANTRVYFNFQNATCRTPGSAESGGNGTCNEINFGGFPCNTQTILGGTVIATEQLADSVLIELSSSPPDSFQAVYLGWSAAENVVTAPAGETSAFGIHHPGVEEKRIALEEDPFITKQTINIGFNVRAWHIDFDEGGLEGGSSGSPLFGADGRVVGTGTAVDQFASICSQNQWYGRLEEAWDLNASFRNSLDNVVPTGTQEQTDLAQFFADTVPEAFGFDLDIPTNGQINVDIGATLFWNGACYTDDNQVVVAEDAGFASIVVSENVLAPTTEFDLDTVAGGTPLQYSTTYFWKIEANNSLGTTITGTQVFTTAPPPPPGSFSLLSPTPGEADVETGPLMDWADALDAADYLLEIDDDIAFGSPLVSQVVVASESDLAVSTLGLSTTYFWRVTAMNVTGDTLSTPSVLAFTTTATPPSDCVGDINGDGDTNAFDFAIFAADFGCITL